MSNPTRRNFIKSGALLSGSALTAPLSGEVLSVEKPSARPSLRLGIVTYQIAQDWNLEKILEDLPQLGIFGVELRDTHAHGVDLSLSSAQRAEIRRRFADSPLELVQLGSAYEFHSPDPAVLHQNIEGAKAYAQLAAEVGCPAVKVRPNGLPAEVPVKKTVAQIGHALQEVGQTAYDLGVEVRVEVHGHGTNRLPIMRQIMDSADHPAVTVNWNCNMDDLADDGFEANFDLVKDRIRHVHINELPNPEYPYPRLFERLREIEYSGWCCAEIKHNPDPQRLLRYYCCLFEWMQG